MNAVLSTILVGVLKMIGWEKLVIKVLEDMAYLVAKKIGIEALEKIFTRIGDALKEVDEKGK